MGFKPQLNKTEETIPAQRETNLLTPSSYNKNINSTYFSSDSELTENEAFETTNLRHKIQPIEKEDIIPVQKTRQKLLTPSSNGEKINPTKYTSDSKLKEDEPSCSSRKSKTKMKNYSVTKSRKLLAPSEFNDDKNSPDLSSNSELSEDEPKICPRRSKVASKKRTRIREDLLPVRTTRKSLTPSTYADRKNSTDLTSDSESPESESGLYSHEVTYLKLIRKFEKKNGDGKSPTKHELFEFSRKGLRSNSPPLTTKSFPCKQCNNSYKNKTWLLKHYYKVH